MLTCDCDSIPDGPSSADQGCTSDEILTYEWSFLQHGAAGDPVVIADNGDKKFYQVPSRLRGKCSVSSTFSHDSHIG